jgi:predicted amidohydrolase YtcJ
MSGLSRRDLIRSGAVAGGVVALGGIAPAIEPGKLADLVVLDRDYFRVSDEDIPNLRSVLTVVDGEIVHDTGMLTG